MVTAVCFICEGDCIMVAITSGQIIPAHHNNLYLNLSMR